MTDGRRPNHAALVALAMILAGSVVASAEPAQPAALGWVRAPGAEGCIGTTELARAVETRLGRAALVSAARAQVSIEGRIAPADEGAGWRVALTVADGTGKVLGTRALARDVTDCRAMDEDVILTVALLVDPEASLTAPPAVSKGTPAAPGTPAAGAPAGSGAPVATGTNAPGTGTNAPGTGTVAHPGSGGPGAEKKDDRAAAPPGAHPWGAAFLVGPVTSIGALPDVAVGAQLRALITPVPFFAFQIGGSVWASQSASFGAAGGRFFLALGAISGCPLTGILAGFRYAACAGVEAGALHAGGLGFPVTLERDDPLVDGLLEARVVRRIVGPLAASMGAGLSVPFLRHDYFYIDPAGAKREVFLASPVSGSLDLLVGIDLR